MARVTCLLLSCLLGLAVAMPPWADKGPGGPGGPGGDGEMSPEMMMMKLKMLIGLENHVREKTEQQVEENGELDDVHQDFIRYAMARKQFEVAQQMQDKGDLLKEAFQHFMDKMKEMRGGEGEGPDMGGQTRPGGGRSHGGDSGMRDGPWGRRDGGMRDGPGVPEEWMRGGPGGNRGGPGGNRGGPGGPGGNRGGDEGMDGEMDERLKMMMMWRLFVEFETAWLQQNNIVSLGLDEKTTRALFFETFGRFVKNSMAIKEKAAAMSKIQDFVQMSQQKAKHDSVKDKFQQFYQMMMSRGGGRGGNDDNDDY